MRYFKIHLKFLKCNWKFPFSFSRNEERHQAPFLTSPNIYNTHPWILKCLSYKSKQNIKYALNFIWSYKFITVHWLEVTGIQKLKIFLIVFPQNSIFTLVGDAFLYFSFVFFFFYYHEKSRAVFHYRWKSVTHKMETSNCIKKWPAFGKCSCNFHFTCRSALLIHRVSDWNHFCLECWILCVSV